MPIRSAKGFACETGYSGTLANRRGRYIFEI